MSKKKKILIPVLAIVLISIFFIGYKVVSIVGIFAEGNSEIYNVENVNVIEDSPLEDKNIIYLGSSVTAGAQSRGTSFVEYIAKRDSTNYIKEAVSGTTLVDNGKKSYVQRMLTIDKNYDADIFVCQLSTNDATKKLPLGEVSDSKNLEDFDTSTITGSMEYIIAYADETWRAPVVFYTGTHYDNKNYDEMVARLHELEVKWGIGVIDMWNDEKLNNISDNERKLYMNDGTIHPTKAGYLKWWTPVIEDGLIKYMK